VLRQTVVITLALFLASCSSNRPNLVDDYFRETFEWNPSAGTAAGFHEYDDKIENRSAEAFTRRITVLKSQLARAEQTTSSSPEDRIDIDLIRDAIRAELLDLETLQIWKTNPIGYARLPGGAVDVLMKRNFAPERERLKSVTSRLRGVPALLDSMRKNVENPPKEFADLAVRVANGSVGFFERDVANWAKQAAGSDTALLQTFEQTNIAAVDAMKKASEWLKSDLAPRAKGTYAIGADNFMKKLLYEESVEFPLDRLLAIGEANLEKDYRDFIETAKRIDPKLPPAKVMHVIEQEHPTEVDLLPSCRRTVQSIRDFVVNRKICTIPSQVPPTIAETPPFARVGTFASMDTPGPFEPKATEAFYYVTPVEKEWDAKHKEEHLRLFNPYVMQLITIHEAYPGHYLQFLWAKDFPSKTRKLTGAASNIEGWAHYSEQMMLEQGYGDGNPRIRLAQLSEALLRDCRYVSGIMLHTRGWTVEQAQKLFIEKGFQQPANAYEEARRGAYNPTYLYYTLGKLMIYKLRDDYQKQKGSAFSLQQFHDEFLRLGPMPLKRIRGLMLPGDTGAVL
jgi:uncharacterized protein (DUF885 family)